jgi:hypothetical protein
MMQCAAFAQRHANEHPLCGLSRLAHGFRHFTRLAMAKSNAALLVAHDNKCRKAEALAALHNLRNAIDVDELVDELAVAFLAVILAVSAPFATFFSHVFFAYSPLFGLEIKSTFARRFRQRFDAPVENIAAAIEDHVLDACLEGALGHQLADLACCRNVRTVFLADLKPSSTVEAKRRLRPSCHR